MNLSRILLAFAAATVSLPSWAAPAHTHGHATLRVAVDGGKLDVLLDTPLDGLVGFERAPRTDAERQAIRDAASKLRAGGLFVPTPAAGCTQKSVKLVSPVLAPDLLGEAPSGAAAPRKSGEHADLEAAIAFECSNAAELKGLETTLLRTFTRIRKLDVQVAGPRGQSKTVLTPGKTAVTWQAPK
jgi:hypothetical protein